MKTLLRSSLLALVAALSFAASPAVYSSNIVGYVNKPFFAGDNLFVNPLGANGVSTSPLSTLFPQVPEGTAISLWDPSSRSFNATSTYQGGLWSVDFSLSLGVGARLSAPTSFTNTFLGWVFDRDGTPLDGGSEWSLPPPFSGLNGIYLLGDILPMESTGNNVFLNVIGRLPNIGEQVITLQQTSTYLGDGMWDIVPSLKVTQAAFFNIGPIPEPSSLSLVLVGLIMFGASRRKA